MWSTRLRESGISRSILDAIFKDATTDKNQPCLSRILAFFAFFQITLTRYHANLFHQLRTDTWRVKEDEYKESFRLGKEDQKLIPIGDLGYSGSTFFTTPNSKFLIKSLPRKFEHEFFRDDLLEPYNNHMKSNPNSLLVRITDLLKAPHPSVGSICGLAPSHHIVMENIMYGRHDEPQGADAWESYDLKPISYFFPERDIAGGRLAPESVKERLADEFKDKIKIDEFQAKELLERLEADTQLLQDQNAIDYSLFLVRYPAGSRPAAVAGTSSAWRRGMPDFDNRWKYRLVLLDFFWARHSTHAKAMHALVESFNTLRGKKGEAPMSITTTPDEYRQRFLAMVREMLDVVYFERRPWLADIEASDSERDEDE